MLICSVSLLKVRSQEKRVAVSTAYMLLTGAPREAPVGGDGMVRFVSADLVPRGFLPVCLCPLRVKGKGQTIREFYTLLLYTPGEVWVCC